MQPTQSPSPQASYIPSQSPPDQQPQAYHILQQQNPSAAILHQQPPPGSQSPQAGQGQPGPQPLYVPQQAGYAIPTGNPSGHPPPPTHVGTTGAVPLGVAMAATAAVAAAAATSVPSQQQAQQQVAAASQTLKGPPQQPPQPNPNEYHVQQCLVQGPPPSTGPPQAPPPHQQHYRILHSTNGYVAAPAAGFTPGPQAGPPHQGPPVIRGIQSAAPPTPPQQDLNKMQQPPPQQMYVQTGGANGSPSVRQNQQMFRGASTTATARPPRQNMPQMYLSTNHSVMLPHTSFHTPYGNGRQQTSYLHFQNSQMAGFSGFQYFIPSTMMPTAPHRGGAVPNQMVANSTPGMQTPVGQGQIVPPCVLTAPGQQGPHMPLPGPNPEKKKRQHAIAIIDPITKKNVLDELDLPKHSSSSMSDSDYQDQYSQNSELAEIGSVSSQDQLSAVSGGNGSMSNPALVNNRQIFYGSDLVSSKTVASCPAIPVNQGLTGTTSVSSVNDAPNSDIRMQNLKPKRSKSDDVIVIHEPPAADKQMKYSPITFMNPEVEFYDEVEETLSLDGPEQVYEDQSDPNLTSALQLESDLTSDSPLGIQHSASLNTISSSATASAASAPLSLGVSSSTSSLGGVSGYSGGNSSAVVAGISYLGSAQQSKTSSLSATSVPFQSSSSVLALSTSSSSLTSVSPLTQPSQTSIGSTSTSPISPVSSAPADNVEEAAEKLITSEDDSIVTGLPSSSSLTSEAASKSTASNSDRSKDSKSQTSISSSSSSTSTNPKDSKSYGSGSSISLTANNSQGNPTSKMTLNEKEVSKSTVTTPHGQTITSSQNLNPVPDRKDSSLLAGTGGINDKTPATTNDRNDNVITCNDRDQNPTKKGTNVAALTNVDMSTENNNASSRISSVSSPDTTSIEEQSIDSEEASLNNNNNSLSVESKVSTESVQSTISSTESNAAESSDSIIDTPRDASSDLNDNQSIGTAGESSSELTETESVTLSTNTIAPSSASADSVSTGSNASKSTTQSTALIQYNEGQWSPFNQDGSKTYDRSQLFALRESPYSKTKPKVAPQILRPPTDTNIQLQHSLLPSFAGKRHGPGGNQSGGNVQLGIRSGVSTGSLGVGPTGGQYAKQASMPGVGNGKSSSRGSKSGMIYLNLSLGEDVKLNETENAWRPARLRADENVPAEEFSTDQLKRKVRGILNKLTPEKFEILVSQIMALQINTAEKIVGVMELVFEKAVDEPAFSLQYARLCLKLIEKKLQSIRDDSSMTEAEEKASNMVVFRNALIDKTQREFEENVLAREAKEKQLRPIIQKIKECTDIEKKFELQANYEEQERKIRRRSGGTVRFIGELFKMNILTVKIIKDCINSLLDPDSEDKLECLCKLLTTAGKTLEKALMKTNELDQTMKEMKQIVDRKKISSRVRFMLQDVIDLRKNKWESKRVEGPTTMEQIQKEAETEQLNTQMLNYNIMPNKKDDRRYGGGGGSGGGGGVGSGSNGGGGSSSNSGMMTGGSGGGGNYNNNKNNNDTWYMKTAKGNRAVDANKLGHMVGISYENPTKLGDASFFQWKPSDSHSTGAKSSFGSMNSFAALSALDSNKGSNSGPRNKGSYNKNSMERDRHDRPQSRTGSTHGSRENSSSRTTRGASITTRPASHSYSSPQPPTRATAGSKSISDRDNARSDRGTSDRTDRNRDRDHRPEPEMQYPDDPDTTNRLIKELISKALEKFIEECPGVMRRYPEKSRWQFFYNIFCDYLHLGDTKVTQRKILAQVFMLFFKQNLITKEHFLKGYSEYSKIAHEILIDVPEAWTGIFQFLVPLIYKKYILARYLWNEELEPHLGKKFIKDFIVYCTREVGPNWTRHLWQASEFKWTHFMPAKDVDTFIKENRLEFIGKKDIPAPIFGSPDLKSVMERVKDLLIDNVGKDEIIDFLNGNIATIEKSFIRALTTTVCEYAIKYINKNYKLDKKTFGEVCMPLLRRYVDSKEELELECLFAIQILIIRLEHPQGVLSELFGEMYDNDVITHDSFIKWRDSKEEPNGKGVAVKGLNRFFNQLLSAETSDENN